MKVERVPVEQSQRSAIQRRTVGVLIVGQVLGGLGFGATLATGSLLFVEISGSGGLAGKGYDTRDLLHGIPEIVAYASDVWTLLPGDIILTGTPAGLGGFIEGQIIDITIEGIGFLSNPAKNRE